MSLCNQIHNPRGLPQLRYEFERDPANAGQSFHFPRSSDLNILEFKPAKQAASGDFASSCMLAVNEEGRGWLTIRGCQSGTTRVLLSADPEEILGDRNHPDEAELSYDNGEPGFLVWIWLLCGSGNDQ